MPLLRQLSEGRLVCPRTRCRLLCEGEVLRAAEGGATYPVVGGVPIFLAVERTGTAPSAMASEYRREPRRVRDALVGWSEIGGDLRNPAATRALASLIPERAESELYLSIGGGPRRISEALVNLNLDLFANVDVVADAHRLPYADESIDGLHCEAVLEHLEEPARAVAEMARVLRRGRRVFAATPFLQAFHGYPDHFQNFTTSGHRRLFERSGLAVVEAGACVGPAFALADLMRNFLRSQLPGGAAGRVAARAVWPLTLPFRWLDAYLLRQPAAQLLCSTTYLVAEKS